MLTRLHVFRSRLAQLCPLTVEDLMKHTVPGLSRNAMNRWGAPLVEALRQGDAYARSATGGSSPPSVSAQSCSTESSLCRKGSHGL